MKFKERKRRLIFISKSGFTEQALKFADESRIMIAARGNFGELIGGLGNGRGI